MIIIMVILIKYVNYVLQIVSNVVVKELTIVNNVILDIINHQMLVLLALKIIIIKLLA